MSKFYLVKILTLILLIIFLIGFIFFPKERNKSEISQNEIDKQQFIKSEEERKEAEREEEYKNQIIEEREREKALGENFATIYYSYSWGNYSNIESQYNAMTEEMKDTEKARVEKLKEKTTNQTQKYFTVKATLINSDIILYEESAIEVKVNLKIDNIDGSIVQKDTMVWVDKNGNYYNSDPKDLIVNTTNKKIKVMLVKIDNKWKVSEIKEI